MIEVAKRSQVITCGDSFYTSTSSVAWDWCLYRRCFVVLLLWLAGICFLQVLFVHQLLLTCFLSVWEMGIFHLFGNSWTGGIWFILGFSDVNNIGACRYSQESDNWKSQKKKKKKKKTHITNLLGRCRCSRNCFCRIVEGGVRSKNCLC